MADEVDEAEIIIGTYEDYVVGYRVDCVDSSGPKRKKLRAENGGVGGKSDGDKTKLYSLEQTFAVRGHSGSVRCLAANSNGSLAFSAGIDEVLNLFSLKRRKLLTNSEAAINCAVFVENYLICGSEDSNLYIYECIGSEMTKVKTLKGHKAPVTSVHAHPSGKVLLSTSKDNSMRTWNLIKGRCAFVSNIKADLVQWSKSGDELVLAANNEVHLINKSGILEHSIKLEKLINSIEFITTNVFVVATSSGNLEFFDLKKGVSMMKFGAHDARIKSVKCLCNDNDQESSTSSSSTLLATASSDGLVKLWSVDKPGIEKPLELASVDTGARLTCMTAVFHKKNR